MLKTPLLNTLVQILGKIVMVGVSLLTTGLLTRGLGLKTYGEFILITSLLIFFDTLSDFGTKIIGVREAAREVEEKNVKKVWVNMAVVRILISIFSFGLGVFFIYLWPDLREIRAAAIVSFLMILLTSVAGSLEIVWQTKQRMAEKVIVEILFPIVFLWGFRQWGKGIGLMGVFWLYLMARVVTLVLGLIRLKNVFDIRQIDKKLMWRMLSLSIPMGLYLLLFTAYDRAIDATMISQFLGKPEVAMYGLSYKIYASLLQPAYFLMNSLFPILSSKSEGKRIIFWKSLLIMLATAGLVVVGVELTAPFMVEVLGGNSFAGAVPVLRLLIWAVVFSYMNHLFGFSLISKNGQKEMVYLGILVLLFNFGANLWAIPHFGMMGAAGVTVASEAMAMCLVGCFLWRKTTKSP